MAPIIYLKSDEVVALHDDVEIRTGDQPSPLSYPDRLDSALNRPRQAAHYEGADLVRQGTLLAVAISQSQSFQNGNKRAAFQAMIVFLELNGLIFNGDPMRLAQWLLDVAEASREDRELIVDCFEAWLRGQV